MSSYIHFSSGEFVQICVNGVLLSFIQFILTFLLFLLQDYLNDYFMVIDKTLIRPIVSYSI